MTKIQAPLSKLTISTADQARQSKHSESFIAALADSIHAIGLLQDMVVVKAKKRGHYEVVAGGGRYLALTLLAERGDFDPKQMLDLRLVDADAALTASLTENTVRAAMHPADEFTAFNQLIEQGKSVEDVAAVFGVTPQVVTRRLKLANVAPSLFELYRNDGMTLECLTAFTLTDDHAKQENVWAGLNHWERNRNGIRRALMQDTMTADDKLVCYVGLDAYQAAGGTVYHDLFSEGQDGIYIQQPELVHRLAQEKLQMLATELQQREGWGWASSDTTIDFEELHQYGRIYSQPREHSDDEQAEIETLNAQVNDLTEQLDVMETDSRADDDDTAYNDLYQKREKLYAKLDEIEENARVWPADLLPLTGVIVTLNYAGEVAYYRGLIRSDDRDAVRVIAQEHDSDDTPITNLRLPSQQTAKVRPVHSEKLIRQLSANKTGIVAAMLASASRQALALLAAHLGNQIFCHHSQQTDTIKISLTPNDWKMKDAAPDFEGSKADIELERHKQHWLATLPTNEHGTVEPLLEWALEQDIATLIEFLAFCVANSIDGLQHTDDTSPLDGIAHTVGLDVAQWWAPTADSYLSRVSKDRITAVVTEAVDAETAAPLQKMKKADAAKAAEDILAGTGWLPSLLRTAQPMSAEH